MDGRNRPEIHFRLETAPGAGQGELFLPEKILDPEDDLEVLRPVDLPARSRLSRFDEGKLFFPEGDRFGIDFRQPADFREPVEKLLFVLRAHRIFVTPRSALPPRG